MGATRLVGPSGEGGADSGTAPAGGGKLDWDTVVFVVAKQSACGVVLDIAEVGEVFALSAGLDKVLPAYVLQ